MARNKNPNSEFGPGRAFRPPKFSFIEKDWTARQNRLREQLPLLWDHCCKGDFGLIATEMRSMLAVVDAEHESFREREGSFFAEILEECNRWKQRRDGLKRRQPELLQALHPLLAALANELRTEAPPSLRPHLSFCFGGLQRLDLLTFPEINSSLPAPFALVGAHEAGEESITGILSDLRGAKAPRSPSELLSRIESLYAHWWRSQSHLTELYGQPSREIMQLAVAARRGLESPIAQHILPVLDALDSALDTAVSAASYSVPPPTLRAAKNILLAFLGAGEIAPIEAKPGIPFEPGVHHAPGSRLPAPGRWVIAKVLRHGYRAGNDILRCAEVEAISV